MRHIRDQRWMLIILNPTIGIQNPRLNQPGQKIIDGVKQLQTNCTYTGYKQIADTVLSMYTVLALGTDCFVQYYLQHVACLGVPLISSESFKPWVIKHDVLLLSTQAQDSLNSLKCSVYTLYSVCVRLCVSVQCVCVCVCSMCVSLCECVWET